MDTPLKDLIDILELSNVAPFHFYSHSEKHTLFAYCCYVTPEEIKNWKNQGLTFHHENHSNELGIHLVNMSAFSLFSMAKERNPYDVKYVINTVGQTYLPNMSPPQLIYATYLILHEVGHWLHFQKSGMSSLDYMKWISPGRTDLDNRAKCIRALSDSDPRKAKLAEVYHTDYQNLPSEVVADQYAVQNFKDKYQLVIDNVLAPLALLESLSGW